MISKPGFDHTDAKPHVVYKFAGNKHSKDMQASLYLQGTMSSNRERNYKMYETSDSFIKIQ